MDKFPHWIDHILVFLLCVGIPLYGIIQRPKGFTNTSFSSEQKKGFYISGSFSLFLLAAVTMGVWLIFRRPLDEIGLTQPANFRSWWVLPLVIIVVYLADVYITISSKSKMEETIDNWKSKAPFLPTKRKELPEYFLLCFSAGVFEEIVYRGYLITYCWYLFAGYDNQSILSVALPAFVFSIAHYYQGAKAVLKIFVLALFFGYLFVYSGSLLIVMILHFLVDAAGGLLTMKYIKEEDKPVGEENNFF